MNEQQVHGDIACEHQLLERLRELFLAHVVLPRPARCPQVLPVNDFYR